MAHFKFSNVIIHGSTFNSAHGGLNVNNRDTESGMRDFMSVPSLKGSLSMTNEGLHTLRLEASLGAIHDSAERYPSPKIVTLILARPFDRLF